MKLLTFVVKSRNEKRFGVLVRDRVFSFDVLLKRRGLGPLNFKDALSYLEHFPESESAARELEAYADRFFDQFERGEKLSLNEVKILPPVPNPPVLLDFALSPRHWKLSARTMLRYEYRGFARVWTTLLVESGFLQPKCVRPGFIYYQCDHTALSGSGDEVCWPVYSSYLDFEPELAFVLGGAEARIAGYLILNDWTARDVQWPEMIEPGRTRSKNFGKSNGLGPFLVTPEEVGNPLALSVAVKSRNRFFWQGLTAEYSRTPEETAAHLKSVFLPPPGTVVGMGAVPGCSGIDQDHWLNPGDEVDITFSKLGTLRQWVPPDVKDLEPSRWPARAVLKYAS